MISMTEFFLFTIPVDGIERLMMHPVDNVPLIYLQENLIHEDVRPYLQSIADAQGVVFKLKHFIFESELEIIEPMKTRTIQ